MPNVICDDFRANVNATLAKQGISRSELASRMGVSAAYISQILNGDHEPGLRVVERIAEALGVQAATLLKKNRKTA